MSVIVRVVWAVFLGLCVLLVVGGGVLQAENMAVDTVVNINPQFVLDTNFGVGGIVMATGFLADEPNSLSLLETEDNQILLTGTWTEAQVGVGRYTAVGEPDLTFGAQGVALARLNESHVFDAARQADGKIVVVGTNRNAGEAEMLLVRFWPTGAVDMTFGTNGLVRITTLDGCHEATAVAILPDGKLLVAGCATDNEFALLRFLPSGAFDGMFGTNGVVTTPVGGSSKMVELLVQTDGGVVLAGRGLFSFRTLLVRYHSDGSLDESFGTAGLVNIQATQGGDQIETAVLQNDGKILLVGAGQQDPEMGRNEAMLLRFDVDGSLDETFGAGGIVTTSLADGAHTAVLRADGAFYIGGMKRHGSFDSAVQDLILLRFLPNGAIDTTFGTDGSMAVLAKNGSGYLPHDMLLQADGQLLLTGKLGASEDVFLMRLKLVTFTEQLFLPLALH